MRIVIAPDSFKGTLSADDAAAAIAAGIARVLPDADLVLRPVADGGEGTVAAALRAGYEARDASVTGPDGRPVEATFAVDGTTAVVELAAAAGLGLLEEPAPMTATTRGVGELLLAALESGARRIVLGLGGSATTDGGAGMLQALGARLLDAAGDDIGPGGAGLATLVRIDLAGLDPRLPETRIVVATDVDNPLTGPSGAAAVFAPQKGAGPVEVALLDAALSRYASVLMHTVGAWVERRQGAGAAGGTAAGAMAVLGAEVTSGAAMVCDLVGLDAALEGADLVLTGEGAFDAQTLRGKAPAKVAARARAAGVPCVVLAGAVQVPPDRLAAAGVAAAHALTEVEPDLDRCRSDAARLLAELAARVVRDGLPEGDAR
ncbi:glycerate kinase [Blastococcus sp. LR1]|uniref:glycerate kinase n=1 Tax=Blastococcus sp. LR1 TaxID=2877000 RepID=UPI001CCA23A4|nr:glycerate kinase [Blastococcus sp. LR1]MCA0143781.1 glycerate kinase [Blastococcus sp. LR1]